MDISKLGQAALFYASKGWNVIPLTENSKFPPKIKEWQHEATIDVDIITQWWSKWPNANIGIATGEKSGIFVLDVDGPLHGTNESKGIDGHNSLEDLLNDHGGAIPDTVEAITPSGGRHIVFKYPTGLVIPNSSNSLGDGLDVKSTNGYIVAAPSVVPAGEYIWDCGLHPEDIPAVECPAWLLSAITTEKPINTDNRPHSFERRITDGPAVHMLRNCQFMQHVQLNAGKLSYGEWLAALTNIVRATDGIEAAHAISALDSTRYEFKICNEKINECLNEIKNPQNCEYIRTNLGFKGCQGGCGIAAPCGWSLGTVPQAKAKIKNIITPTPENVNNPEILGALAILQKKEPLVFDEFMGRYSGTKKSLTDTLKQQKIEAAGFAVIDGGQAEGTVNNPNTERWLSQTVPDVPVDLLLPDNPTNYSLWVFNYNGINIRQTVISANGDKTEKNKNACTTPAIISEEIFNIDTKQLKTKIIFKHMIMGWKSIVVTNSILSNSRSLVSLSDAGLGVTSNNANELVDWFSYLRLKNKNIPTKQGVSKMGWRNNETEFVLPGLETKYVIDIGDDAAEYSISGLGQAGDFGQWINTMQQLRTRNKARFILAASFAAPLLKITGQRSFLIHNWDNSQGGKSATLFAALSVWGKPEEISKTFSDSKTSTERAASMFTDLPFGINEYELLNDRQKAEIDSTIYMISEGKGKGRATKDGVQKTVSWRTIAIMTGESKITRSNSRGGIFTRLIEIKGGPLVDDDIFASNLYPFTAKNYGHAGKLFIERLLQTDYDWIRETYNKTRMTLRDKYPNKINTHMDALACIGLADYLVSMWIWGIDEQRAASESIVMLEGIIKGLTTKIEADESERAWEWLPDWIATNENRFMKASDYNKKNVNSWLGYNDSDSICIIKTEMEKALTAEGFNSGKVLNAWADAGKFQCTIEGSGRRKIGVRYSSNIGEIKRPYIIKINNE